MSESDIQDDGMNANNLGEESGSGKPKPRSGLSGFKCGSRLRGPSGSGLQSTLGGLT